MAKPQINITVESASNRWFQIIGTLLMCGSIGLMAYALAQRGWIEIAATMVTVFLFQFARMLISNGLMVLPKATLAEGDFSETRNALQTAYAEYQIWQSRSPVWRLCALSIAYTIVFMASRWAVSVGLVVFSNQWVAGAAVSLLGAIIIAPNLIGDLFSKMKASSSKVDEDSQKNEG